MKTKRFNYYGNVRRHFLSLTGFTFIEVLIVLTVFSVIVLAVYGVSRGCIEIYRRTQDFDLKERRIILSLERLTEGLRQVVSLDRLGSEVPEELLFEGKADNVSFIVANRDGFYRLSYAFISDINELFKLRFAEEDLREEKLPSERDLAGGIKKGSIDAFLQYLKYNNKLEAYEWVDEWEEEPGLPKAVRIEVGYELDDDDKDIQIFKKRIFVLQ